MQAEDLCNKKIAIIGLGYVGLPLAVEFGKKYDTIGFDVNENRVKELCAGTDSTLEVNADELRSAERLSYSCDKESIKSASIYIVTVPTPIDEHKQPDLRPLIKASEMLGGVISKGDIVIYESTVYPGATEDDCIPVIEEVSGLKYNEDFFAGYSPERINPGDKNHRLINILKVTSGSNEEIAETVDSLYNSIIEAGTYKAESIRVAEAAKVIENTQRDINIALVNELSIIFKRLNIDTHEVLAAAGTKWNFLPFKPGLVGGHCIGVDPYYLTHKAQATGYHPEIILAGRRINDGMGRYVVSELIKGMLKERIQVVGANILVMGLTFKENCPDIRNTKVVDIIDELNSYEVNIDICDPWCSADEAKHEYGLTLTEAQENKYDAIVLAVGHQQFVEMGVENIRKLGKDKHVIFDIKSILPKDEVDMRL